MWLFFAMKRRVYGTAIQNYGDDPRGYFFLLQTLLYYYKYGYQYGFYVYGTSELSVDVICLKVM